MFCFFSMLVTVTSLFGVCARVRACVRCQLRYKVLGILRAQRNKHARNKRSFVT
jgi:hypothetical protein